MTSKEIGTHKLQQLDEALEFAHQVDRKIQEFNLSSAQVAAKWQKKVEKRIEQSES